MEDFVAFVLKATLFCMCSYTEFFFLYLWLELSLFFRVTRIHASLCFVATVFIMFYWLVCDPQIYICGHDPFIGRPNGYGFRFIFYLYGAVALYTIEADPVRRFTSDKLFIKTLVGTIYATTCVYWLDLEHIHLFLTTLINSEYIVSGIISIITVLTYIVCAISWGWLLELLRTGHTLKHKDNLPETPVYVIDLEDRPAYLLDKIESFNKQVRRGSVSRWDYCDITIGIIRFFLVFITRIYLCCYMLT